jgi:hypothetical protein
MLGSLRIRTIDADLAPTMADKDPTSTCSNVRMPSIFVHTIVTLAPLPATTVPTSRASVFRLWPSIDGASLPPDGHAWLQFGRTRGFCGHYATRASNQMLSLEIVIH